MFSPCPISFFSNLVAMDYPKTQFIKVRLFLEQLATILSALVILEWLVVSSKVKILVAT